MSADETIDELYDNARLLIKKLDKLRRLYAKRIEKCDDVLQRIEGIRKKNRARKNFLSVYIF